MKSALRLRRPSDFARVEQTGAVYRRHGLLIGVCKNDASHNRYGFVASRRLGNAVVRNTCKRRLRAIVRALHSTLRQGFDVVIVARPAATRKQFSRLQRTVRELFVQARLIGNHQEC